MSAARDIGARPAAAAPISAGGEAVPPRAIPARAHPPWRPFSDGAWKSADYMTERGAHRLAALITAAWARCGIDIQTQVVPTNGRLDGIYTVRILDMIGGLPVSRERP